MEISRSRFSGTFKHLLIGISAMIALMSLVQAQEVPYGTSIPMSSRDRVYTADQISNTVSVIDPSSNRLLGVIRLGEPITAVLSPLYKGQLLVHGLGFAPDHRTLAAIAIGSNSVTLIDTATNRVKGTLYIGRSPHEGFFTPNGKKLWVAVRGEDYLAVIDPVSMKEVRRIRVANGPGMVLFRPDGRYAFVPSSFTPELAVIDVRSYKVIAKVQQASPFSPNLAVSPDGSEVWFTLKDIGKTQAISAKPPFNTLATLDTGPITNHVNFVDNANGHFVYVTVGGLNEVKVYRRGAPPELVATIPVGNLPHGIWPSGDGKRMYVGLENGDAVQVIDTLTNQTIATIPVGQLPQALVYVPDAVPSGPGTSNLVPLKETEQARQVQMESPSGEGKAQATVVINALGQVDQLQIAASGLEPGQEYQLYMVDTPKPPYGNRTPLARFKANPAGTAIAQTIGPMRSVVAQPGATQPVPHYLVLTSVSNDQAVLVEQAR
jgi:YVTN family beta-propeller protein